MRQPSCSQIGSWSSLIQGLDFFAEVPVLEDKMPAAGGVANAVVVLILRAMSRITSTGIRWLERYAKQLQANGSLLIMADIDPMVFKELQASGALDVIGQDNIIPATRLILEAERTA